MYYAPPAKSGKVAWACGECFKPIRTGTFLTYLSRCDDCLNEFSSPWEDICEKCHKIEYSDISLVDGKVRAALRPDAPPYRGWSWGAEKHRRGHQEVREWRSRQPWGKESPKLES